MTNIELFYFLGKCLTLGENAGKDRDVISIIRQKEVDWECFVALASRHLVLPSVYLRFKQQGILPILPEELNEHLQMVYELNFQRNTAILKQIKQINRLFASVGIVPIYLKGAGNLLDYLYEDTGERMVGDIDLLVSDAEFLQAAILLKGEGYEHAHPFFEDDQALTKHFPRLVHPTELADVEVHRIPVELQLSAHFSYSVICPDAKLLLTDPPCYVLSDKHKVILNFMHGFMATDVALMNLISYRNMYDLFLLTRRIDVFEVLTDHTQYANKALVYANFMHHAMDIDSKHSLSFRSKRFIRRHDLFLKSKLLYQTSWLSNYLISRIWSGYLSNAVGVIFSKQIRRSVFRRLGDPQWYKLHLKSYTFSFNQNLRNNMKVENS